MITAAHIILNSKTPPPTGPSSATSSTCPRLTGHGWLIFALPPAEAAVHPSVESEAHELYFLTDDVQAEVVSLTQKGIECSAIHEQRWGSVTKIRLPGCGQVGLYQPKRPTAVSR